MCDCVHITTEVRDRVTVAVPYTTVLQNEEAERGRGGVVAPRDVLSDVPDRSGGGAGTGRRPLVKSCIT